MDNDSLYYENLSFILNKKNNLSLITSTVIFELIEKKKYNLLKLIFQHSFIEDKYIKNVIFDIFIINCYKNKKTLSNIQIIKLIKNNIPIININEKYSDGNFPLVHSVCINEIDIVKLLMDYGDEYNILLNVNGKDKEHYFPLMNALYCNNIKMVKLLMEYCDNHNIILNINEKFSKKLYPLKIASFKNNYDIIKLLLDYEDKHDIILNLNYCNYPVQEAFKILYNILNI